MNTAEPQEQEHPSGPIGRLFDLLGVERPANAFDRNNALSVFLMGALPPIAGSTISFMLGTFLVWGVISLARRRFAFRLTRSDRQIAWTFTAFVVLVLATGMLAPNRDQLLGSVLWLLPFLSLWVVIPRLRASPSLDYLHLYILGAAMGCIAALAFAGTQAWLTGLARIEGGSGNAAVFASMCVCLAGVAGLAIDAPRRGHRLLAGIAVLAGASAVILSLTRGAMLALPPVLIVLFVYSRRRWLVVLRRPTTLAAFLVAAAGLLLYREAIMRRVLGTAMEIGRLLEGGHSWSIGERLRLWHAAWQAFLEAPLLGHGIQNRMASLVPYLHDDRLPIWGFTHPHNGYLAAMLDGGVVVLAALLAMLAAPVVAAWNAARDTAWRRRLFLSLVLVTAYGVIGLTQIMFKHDIMDSFYIFTVIVLAASIPETAMAGIPERPKPADADAVR